MPTIVRSGGGGGADVSALTNAATTNQVLEGYQFYGAGSEDPQTGTIKNNGTVTETVPYSGSGYYSSITISTSGNAEASHVLSGKTFMNSKGEQTGSMVDRSSKTTINIGETGNAGYYSSISVNSNSLGNATSAHVLSNVSFTNTSKTTYNGSIAIKGNYAPTLNFGSQMNSGAGYYDSININVPSLSGTATSSQVLSGYSFMNSSGAQTGGLTNKTINTSVGIGGTYTNTTAGYYTNIKVAGPTLNDATATKDKVLSGYIFYNSSGKQTGSYTAPTFNRFYKNNVDITGGWKIATVDTIGFWPSYYAVCYNDGNWGTTTRGAIKCYQNTSTGAIHYCHSSSGTYSSKGRIIAYA